MGHAGKEKMKLLNQAVTGMTDITTKPQGLCKTCTLSKSVQNVNRDAVNRVTKRLGRVYTDFWGPFATLTLSRVKYMLMFTDNYTRKAWIYLTKTCTELYEKFRE
jgi:hypothetical protein